MILDLIFSLYFVLFIVYGALIYFILFKKIHVYCCVLSTKPKTCGNARYLLVIICFCPLYLYKSKNKLQHLIQSGIIAYLFAQGRGYNCLRGVVFQPMFRARSTLARVNFATSTYIKNKNAQTHQKEMRNMKNRSSNK